MGKKIYIFGASELGKQAKKNIEVQIYGFIDNDMNKIGNIIEGKKIYALEELREELDGIEIIIASQYNLEIANQLFKFGIYEFKIFIKEKKGKLLSINLKGREVRSEKSMALILNNKSGSNTYALSKYLEKKEVNFKYYILKENEKDEEYFINLFKSEIIVGTHEGGYVKDKINVQLWHGFPYKGLSYMSNYENQNSERAHNEWRKISIIPSYSQLYNTLMGSCYGIEKNKFIITGAPRNDLLLNSNGRGILNKIDKRFKDKKIFFYIPTFRETTHGEVNGEKESYLFNWSDMDIIEFDKYLNENNIMLIYKFHPEEKNKKDNIKTYNIIDYTDLEFNGDLYEILNAGDLLITDYSSIYFDYLLLNKPIIFLNKDFQSYVENRGVLLEPYEYWMVGGKVNTYKGIKEEINKVLNGRDEFSKERNQIKKLVHKYDSGNYSEKVIDAILSYMQGGS